MQSKCKLINYKVPSFSYTVDIKNKNIQKRCMSYENTIKISFPDEDLSKGMMVIETNAIDDTGEIKFNIKIRGVFVFTDDKLIGKEKENILKTEGFPQLYQKMNDIFASIQKITQQNIPELPDVMDIEPLN